MPFLIAVALTAGCTFAEASATAADASQGKLTADLLQWDGQRQRFIAQGHAELSTPEGLLRAERIEFEQDRQVAHAFGDVRLLSFAGGALVVLAQAASVHFEKGQVDWLHLEDGRLLGKSDIAFETLRQAKSKEELIHWGKTTLSMGARHLRRKARGTWEIEDVSMTPCDCDLNHPSWRIDATKAALHLEDEYVTLLFPRVFAPVPVLWLPWVYVPLSSRKTGFLVPRPATTSLNGFSLETPFFLTLGDSRDLTFTPGYFSGIDALSDGTPRPQGVKGPRLLTEYRYTPSENTRGRATFGILDDAKGKRNPVTGQFLTGAGRRGTRFEGSWQHQQEWASHWSSRVNAAVVSDGFYVSDLTPDVISREAEYLRSTASVSHRGDDVYWGVDATFRQDLRWGYSLFGRNADENGPLRGPNTIQRWPSLTWAVPERPLGGPLWASFRAELTRQAPLWGVTGDEGSAASQGSERLPDGTVLSADQLRLRLFCPTSDCLARMSEIGQGDGVFQAGEREARNRLDLFPRLSASYLLGDFLQVTPYAAYRQTVYVGEATGALSHRGYGMLGVFADTEVSRTFQEGRLRHALAPRAELRYVPHTFGTLPSPYDAIDDSLGTQRRLFQATLALRQSLQHRQAGVSTELARLELGQGVNLLGETFLGETWATGLFRLFGVTLDGHARYDISANEVTQASVGAGVLLWPGASLSSRYERMSPLGSMQVRSGIDMLFGRRHVSSDALYTPEQLTVGAQASLFRGVGLTYQALVARGVVPADPLSSAMWLRQQTLGVSYAPACDCWRLEAYATQIPDIGQPFPGRDFIDAFGATLTISNFGSFGTGG